MAGAAFTLDVRQVQRLATRLSADMAGAARAVEADLLDSVGEKMESQAGERFEDKRGPDGEKWPKWSDDYRARRPRKGGLLDLSGRLRGDVTHDVAGDAARAGVVTKYGATHQFGDQRLAWGRVQVEYPPRPFVGIGERDRDEIEQLMRGVLEDLA